MTQICRSAHLGAAVSYAACDVVYPAQSTKKEPPAQQSRWWNELRQLASLLLTVFLSFYCALSSAQQTANYIYDELGRLKTVVAPNGDRAEYDYDAVGNLLAVRRIGTNTLTVSEITPNVGTSGTVVIIRGAGFSATPASNTVKFNGVAATVTAATTTQLTVAAPATGTTGTISVTVAAGTATSQEIFTYVIGTTVGGPTITSFSPTNGPAATQVTITGTNFELAPGATKVELNGVSMPLVSLTATQIVVKVPADVASGKIRVITPKGIAVSAGYFYVPIPNYADVDIVDRQSITIGGAASTVNVATANKYGLLLFDGAQNDYLTLQLSDLTNNSGGYSYFFLFGPDNILLTSWYRLPGPQTLHLPRLPLKGTYSLVISGGYGATNLTGKLSKDATLVAGATATAVTQSVSGQSIRYIFNVALGSTLGVGLTDLAFNPANTATQYQSTSMTVYKPDGVAEIVGSDGYSNISCFAATGCHGEVINAQVAGTYSVVIGPHAEGFSSTTFSLLLSVAQAGVLTVNGSSGTAVSIARAGQNARYTFAAAAGQNLGIGLTDLITTATSARMSAYYPTGLLYSTTSCETNYGSCSLNLNNLAAGTYNVVVSFGGAGTGSFKLQVNSDATGSLVANAAANVSLKPGQNARYTFNGTAGQSVGIELAQLVTAPNLPDRTLNVYIYRQTDPIVLSNRDFVGAWQSTYVANSGGSVLLPSLPTAGTYTVIVDDATYALSATFALKLNAGTPLVAGANALTVSTTGAGQNPRYTFNVALGGSVGIGLTGLAYIPADATTQTLATAMSLYMPDGTKLLSTNCSIAYNNGGCNLDLVSATIAGTYSIVIEPPPLATSTSFAIQLSAPVAGVLTVGSASSTSVTIARPGQNARYTFVATSGQNVGVGLSDLIITPGTVSTANLTAYRPDGSILVSTLCYLSDAGCSLNLNNLSAGTYSVVASMIQGATGSFKLQVNNDSPGTLIANSLANLSLKSGQNARYIFNGVAAQSVAIELTQLSTSPATARGLVKLYIYRPTDTITLNGEYFSDYWLAFDFDFRGGTIPLPALPATGTYVIVADPSFGVSATFGLKVDSGVPLVAGAAATNVTNTIAGQKSRFTFDMAAGGSVGIGLTALTYTITGFEYTNMSVYSPDGTRLTYTTACNSAAKSCSLNVVNVPVAGRYSIILEPPSSATPVSFTIQLSAPVAGTLAVGGASGTVVTIARPGQNAKYTFVATAGQNVGVGLSDLLITPASATGVDISAYRPDGSLLISRPNGASSGVKLNLLNLVAGTYSIVASISAAATGSFKLQVNNDSVGALIVNTASNVNLKPGQNARYTFNGIAGQSVGIELAQLVVNPDLAGRAVVVFVYRPTDTIGLFGSGFNGSWQSFVVYGSGGTLQLPALPTTGVYTIIVDQDIYCAAETFTLKARSP